MMNFVCRDQDLLASKRAPSTHRLLSPNQPPVAAAGRHIGEGPARRDAGPRVEGRKIAWPLMRAEGVDRRTRIGEARTRGQKGWPGAASGG